MQYKIKLLRLLLKDEKIPKEKIRPLMTFIDHLIELPNDETEELVRQISPLFETEEITMALNLEDTSIAKYYKKIGREEGIKESNVKVGS